MIGVRLGLVWATLSAAAVVAWSVPQLGTGAPKGSRAMIAGVDMTTPAARWALPDALQEISGLAAADPGRVLAHNDEIGVIYEIDYRNGRVGRQWTLGSPRIDADFEGVELVGRRVTLMSSDGRLFSGDIPRSGELIAPVTLTDTGLGRRCELEGLGIAQDGSWLLPCKAERGRRGDPFTILFWPETPPGTAREVFMRASVRRLPLHPSAVVQTSSRTLVVLFGPEQAIGEFDAGGRPIALLKLDTRRHAQPEGLAIAADGTLLIADEGRVGGRAGTLAAYAPAR